MTEWRRSGATTDAGGKPYPNESSIELYKGEDRNGVWPSDMAEYYDKIDEERGLPKATLCKGYGRK